MNYIEFEVGGKLRGFKFGLGFFGDLQKHFNADFEDIQSLIKKNSILFLPAMLFYGHKHDCIRKGVPVTFELWNFEDWIVELEGGITNVNILEAARAMNQGVQHIMGVSSKEDEGSKKK